MSAVSLHKDRALTRVELAAIAEILYGTSERWYAELARDLTGLRGLGPIAPAVVQGWMRVEGRSPPWWATPLVYRLLANGKADLEVRAQRAGDWANLLQNEHMKR